MTESLQIWSKWKILLKFLHFLVTISQEHINQYIVYLRFENFRQREIKYQPINSNLVNWAFKAKNGLNTDAGVTLCYKK